MDQFGFKILNHNNWLQPDPTSQLWVKWTQDGMKEVTGDDWLEDCLSINLEPNVPIEVIRLFEVAKGTVVYGYYFYPLFTLAEQQIYRVADTATFFKCKNEGASKTVMKEFNKRITWLICNKHIKKHEYPRWNAIRLLRNASSHPKDQEITLPTEVIKTLRIVANMVNSLFL